MINHNLYLHNSDTYTRVDLSRNKKSNIDLVFTTVDLSSFVSVNVLNDTLGSDHYPISITIDVEKFHYERKAFIIQTKKTDWINFTKLLDDEYNKFLTTEYDNLPTLEKYNLFISSSLKR